MVGVADPLRVANLSYLLFSKADTESITVCVRSFEMYRNLREPDRQDMVYCHSFS
jgi:hypothetical protein